MALFDLLRRRGVREAEAPDPAAGPHQPPSVHYVFAHHALRSVAFENPGGFLAAMSDSNPTRQSILQDLWGQARAACPWDNSAGRRLPPLKIRPFLLFENCGILVELPEPRGLAEAYFSAVVVRLPESAEPTPPAPPPTWYFTLERASTLLINLLPEANRDRLVLALRRDPNLLITLMRETMFRYCFMQELNERMLPALGRDPRLREIVAAILHDPERLVNDPARLALFLDDYERRRTPTSTVLCGWTAEGVHENHGPGPRPDCRLFLAELAVWFAMSRPRDSSDPASTDPIAPTR